MPWISRILIERLVRLAEERTQAIMDNTQALADLTTAVTAQAAADTAAANAIKDLAAKLAAGTTPPADVSAQMEALATQLTANAKALTDAISAAGEPTA